MVVPIQKNGRHFKALGDKNKRKVYDYLQGRAEVNITKMAADLGFCRMTATRHYKAIRDGWKPVGEA